MNELVASGKRVFAVFRARNLEFVRDKGSIGWSFFMPILLITAMSFAFDGDGKAMYKVGVMNALPEVSQQHSTHTEMAEEVKQAFWTLKHVEFVVYHDLEKAQSKVQQHAIDLLVDWQQKAYWVNDTSPNGYMTEQLLLGAEKGYLREVLNGREIRYIDWLIPGILGMNIMFGSLIGASYVIVRYRKNSVLKRLKATPLKATEFIIAQILSRLVVVIGMASLVFVVCNFMFDFFMLGSYFSLFLVGVTGTLCMISFGLLMSSRSHSEELTGGLIQLITWPMMLLSGVWFSLEGASELIQDVSQLFPLTHMLNAARAIMTEGATLADIYFELLLLSGLTVVFISAAGFLFRWEGDGR